jgi:chromosome segregation ATPase
MANLSERLRQWAEFGYGVEASATMREAADEITRLRAEVERLTKRDDIHLKTRDRVLGVELEDWSKKYATLRAEVERLDKTANSRLVALKISSDNCDTLRADNERLENALNGLPGAIRAASETSPYRKGMTVDFCYGLSDGYEAAAQIVDKTIDALNPQRAGGGNG